MRRGYRLWIIRSALLIVALVLAGATSAAHAATTGVLETRVLGYSVEHRPIVAYHVGTGVGRPSLVLGQMHGDEPAGVIVTRAMVRRAAQLSGLNLWIVPTMNPDGSAHHTRQNAHHVDLNRNWPDSWRHLTGIYYSGPRPLSEPETQAMYGFLRTVRPYYVLSLHQPLDGVDTLTTGTAVSKRIAANLGLARKAFRCWSVCHGSMTDWFEHHHYGIADTVEFAAAPSWGYLAGRARIGLVAAMGGRYTVLASYPGARLVSVRMRTPGGTQRYCFRVRATREGTGHPARCG